MFDFICNRLFGFLLDSLWIGAASWFVLFLLMKTITRRWANFRYYLALSVFFGFVIVLTLSFFAGDSMYTLWLKPKVLIIANDFETYHLSFGILEYAQVFLLDHSYYLLWLWVLGLLFFAVNFYLQSRNVHRFVEAKQPEVYLSTLKESLMYSLGIKTHVGLKIMENVSHPFTMGYFKPIIYFPLEALTGFHHEELELILVHELIHIKRSDYAINLLQLGIETVFFFNPFVWHMSTLVRNERETSCDYEVIRKGYNKIAYAKALEKSYELHYNLALGFGSRNILSRLKALTTFRVPLQNGTKKDRLMFTSLLFFFVTVSLGFGLMTKTTLLPNLITKGTEVYPRFKIKDTGTVIFNPDEHRAWHIYKNGAQAFYKDGVLTNHELDANFEYREIDKGDVIEIRYVDKLLNKEHKGFRTKNITQWKALLHEIQIDYGLPGTDFSKATFNTAIHQTPFGELYVFDKKLPALAVASYRKKYPDAMRLFKSRYSPNDKAFLRQMILELQNDGLVSSDFDTVQVLFKVKKDGKLQLNKEVLSKTHSAKYIIYLKEISGGFLYEETDYYIK